MTSINPGAPVGGVRKVVNVVCQDRFVRGAQVRSRDMNKSCPVKKEPRH
jgi:hypothetical protein